MLDLKMIESGKFIARKEKFSPLTTLEFVMAIFKEQAK